MDTFITIVSLVLMGAFVICIIGAIAFFIIYPLFSGEGEGCPKCKQRYAMVKTGRKKTKGTFENDLYEVKCTSCGHREWKKESSAGDDGA